MKKFTELNKKLAQGWNTWDTCSVTTYVKLPEAFALKLGIKEHRNGNLLKNPLVGLQGEDDPVVTPGAHTYDGCYTKLQIAWRDIILNIETAAIENDYVILVTPLKNQLKSATLIVESAMLWNHSGQLARVGDKLKATLSQGKISVFSTVTPRDDVWADCSTPFLMLPTDEELGISTGKARDINEIKEIVSTAKNEHETNAAKLGDLQETWSAMHNCMAWDTIYEPEFQRVVSPVSRIWSRHTGGFTLFCWDTYFGAFLASFENKDVAYANAIAITRDAVDGIFVPNCDNGVFQSRDRSQPPVGSMMVELIYQRYQEKWLLEEVYDVLFRWNSWWLEKRITDGLLCWGSNPYEPTVGNSWESNGVNDRFGAALESGLDNSPMYDDIPFDKERHQLKLQDVGLNGLFVGDCESLGNIADVLGKTEDAKDLRQRAENIRLRMQELWCEEFGMFLNRRTDTGEFSYRISPTNFYSMLGNIATPEQAQRMVYEHMMNPKEFWGDWVLPSISRNDPAYPEQTYWRGRIWAPMNFLVYLGLRNYDLPETRKALADKSNELIMKEWLEHGHVHENYCADTGQGCNRGNSDRFYHWGGLLSAIPLMESEI